MTREQVLKIVRPAILDAFPDSGRILVRTVEMAMLGVHAPDMKRPFCASCGLPRLPEAFRLCRRCIRLAHGIVVGWRVGKEPPGWETALADVKRALREQDHPQIDDVTAILESRMSGGFDPTPGGQACLICRRLESEVRRLVDGPRNSICSDCVEVLFRDKSR